MQIKLLRNYIMLSAHLIFWVHKNLELQYRGRLNNKRENPEVVSRDLFDAMQMIADTGEGPREQSPSIGCSIKWKSE